MSKIVGIDLGTIIVPYLIRDLYNNCMDSRFRGNDKGGVNI